jgi:hypothetical protein
MATCAQCGAEVEGAFCGECGAKVEAAATSGPSAPVSTLPPSEVRRPEPSAFVVRVAGPFGEGSKVTVGAGDRFVGERFGACSMLLPAGEHAIDEEIEAGWFVREQLELSFEEELGAFEDARAARSLVAARGTVRFRIDEPRDYVTSVLEAGGVVPDVPAVAAKLRAKLAELIGEQIRTLLAKGRYFTTLHSTQAVDEMRVEVREIYAGDAERDPATSIELAKLQLGTEPIEEAPMTTSRPLAFATGARVTVAWTDGRRYPGVVRTTACLVAFDDGQEQWIPLDAIVEEEPPSGG